MSLFQPRSRTSSAVLMGNSPNSFSFNSHAQHHHNQQQQPSSQHQPQFHHTGPSLASSSLALQHDNSIDHSPYGQHQRHKGSTRPQFFSDFFRKYELMIEFTNLRNPHHCPSGLYVMPAVDNINLWFGTLFVHKGYYRNAVFKFQLVIPPEYPERRPTVHFLSDLFHPLIDQHGQLALQYQFPQWRPHRDYLFHVLHYVKAIFKKCVLDTVVEKQAVNKEAYRMYRNENTIFAKLAQQRAQLSITDSNLYDNYPANNSIKFGPLGDQEFDELKQKMISSASSGHLPSMGDRASLTQAGRSR
ncbi:hypothetical protein MVEG_07531 [Podila verticillata NRRL 6337]|nr:hypothetical protein MVEG_07531 [Podila verticillata NRRL 6337]